MSSEQRYHVVGTFVGDRYFEHPKVGAMTLRQAHITLPLNCTWAVLAPANPPPDYVLADRADIQIALLWKPSSDTQQVALGKHYEFDSLNAAIAAGRMLQTDS